MAVLVHYNSLGFEAELLAGIVQELLYDRRLHSHVGTVFTTGHGK
jgi:hypothetical protein